MQSCAEFLFFTHSQSEQYVFTLDNKLRITNFHDEIITFDIANVDSLKKFLCLKLLQTFSDDGHCHIKLNVQSRELLNCIYDKSYKDNDTMYAIIDGVVSALQDFTLY